MSERDVEVLMSAVLMAIYIAKAEKKAEPGLLLPQFTMAKIYTFVIPQPLGDHLSAQFLRLQGIHSEVDEQDPSKDLDYQEAQLQDSVRRLGSIALRCVTYYTERHPEANTDETREHLASLWGKWGL